MHPRPSLFSRSLLLWLGLLPLASCGSDDAGAGGGDGNGVPSDAEVARADGGADGCGGLVATVRDFRAEHPDFESFTGDEVFVGIVAQELGDEGKPVYAAAGATAHTTGPAEFAQWYRDVPEVNIAIQTQINLSAAGGGRFVYDDDTFFPIDGQGFADSDTGDDGQPHNFHFTTEVRTSFVYEAGQSFSFTGDDDLWLFVNGKLALDLGGLHQPATGVVNMDAIAGEFGLVVGETYPMDIFHAERHTTGSNFHIETTIDCFVVQ